MAVDVSFVVPTLNAEHLLPACLTSIRRQHFDANRIEILVPDGGSTDGTARIAASLGARVLDAAGERPVTFRTLDVGGDKVLPYMRVVEEENPALGWRAIRLGLDRPGLLRSQIRALLRAAAGRRRDARRARRASPPA